MAFEKLNVVLIGVSRDSIKSHQKFIEEQELDVLLLSDKESILCECFEVLKLKKNYGKEYLGVERSTFLLDEKGEIIKEWRNVKVEGHAGEVYEFVASLK
ncbi:MAG: peroxiredoxin Q/BCP [Fusobacteria bacterium]|nr:MAG: peroxiredoxin Q/BCP [Fusobacteriota bacterium]KAF0227918.1 MAG: peroxiredoxin [Fusobacteriota bacterium]